MNRQEQIQLNNQWFRSNIDHIRSEAPRGAIGVVVHQQEIAQYFQDWFEAMDAVGTRAGAVMFDL